MARPHGMNSLFGSRWKKPAASRKRKPRQQQRFAAPESLERRAMLAFSPLAPAGDQLGNPITISTDGDNAMHELTIILDDVITPGTVTATITTSVDGVLDQTAQYFNFSGIGFSGVNDRDGSVVNRVSIWTSYEANLLGREAAPSDDADVGLSTNWLVFNQFPAGISVGTTVLVDLFNADALTVTGGVRGGGDSTIAGEFESPTLPETIDSGNPDSYANIALLSGVGIADDASGDPIVASALTLKSQTNEILLTQDIFTRFDLSLEAAQDITLANLVEVREGDVSLVSSSGSIAVLDLIHAMAGGITIDSDCDEVAIERLCAFEDISINAPQGVVVFNELRSETGGVTITADAGPMRIRDVFTERNIQMSAAESITLFGLLEASSGEIVVSTTSGAILLVGAQLHALDNQIKLEAHSRIIQDAPGGLIRVDVLSTGRLPGAAGDSTPDVTVEIAPPAGGGETATAQAVILRSPAPTADDPEAVVFSVLEILLTSRGSGYAINESPVVTINGLPGAIGVAVGPRWAEHIVAETDVTLAAGEDIVLTTIVRSNEGDVRISSIDGNVDLSAEEHLVHAVAGSVNVLSQAGGITVQQVTAGGSIDARALEAISLRGRQTAATGDIGFESLQGEISVGASVAALQGTLSLVAFDSVNQTSSGGIAGITLLAGGSGYSSGASVSIAPPAAGGAAATAVAVIEDGVVVGITLTSPGSGYALGESPAVTITGATTPGGAPNVPPTVQGGGAAAVAEGPAGLLSIFSRDDLSIAAGAVVTLGSTVRSAEGDVRITSTNADLALGAGSLWVQADAGSAVLSALVGFATVNRITVTGDASLTAAIDTTVVSSLTVGGNATVVSTNGQANVQDASVGGNLVIRGEKGGVLNGELIVETGDMQVTSGVGSIQINGGLTVKAGSLDMVAGSAITQSSNSGITELQLLAGGSGYLNGASVQIAPPAAGGTAATAVAVVSSQGIVTGLTITNAGSGYAVGETPRVTIVGGDDQLGEPVGGGAAAAAVGPAGLQNITVEDDIRIATGQGATLTSTIRSNAGNILVTAANGNLGLDAGSLFLNSVAGDVTVIAQAGRVEVQKVVAGGQVTLNGLEDIRSAGLITASSEGVLLESSRGSVETNELVAQSGVQVKSFENIKFTGLVHSAEGDILANSQTGVMSLAANIIAEAGQVSLSAFNPFCSRVTPESLGLS